MITYSTLHYFAHTTPDAYLYAASTHGVLLPLSVLSACGEMDIDYVPDTVGEVLRWESDISIDDEDPTLADRSQSIHYGNTYFSAAQLVSVGAASYLILTTSNERSN